MTGGGKRLIVPYYSPERRAALLKMLLPPQNLSMAEVSRREGVSEMSLSNWRKQLSYEGNEVSEKTPLTENGQPKPGLLIVLEADR
ncbi:transposase, partial [Pseudomonas syringae pv. actinidiae]|nr:transposase [Pseudomonas syringae pv. actinidiae]NVL45486.1 transposase [Pseudomonas syringae pv. actinidiae]